jgi:hypothetical protein
LEWGEREPDPIFEAIERYREADVTLSKALQAEDPHGCDQAGEAMFDTKMKVFDTPATTLAGMRAKIDFAMSESHIFECLKDNPDDQPLRNFLKTLSECAMLAEFAS